VDFLELGVFRTRITP